MITNARQDQIECPAETATFEHRTLAGVEYTHIGAGMCPYCEKVVPVYVKSGKQGGLAFVYNDEVKCEHYPFAASGGPGVITILFREA